MECKNCQTSLRSDFSYCPTCGAKIIRNRLTLKNIWQDISFQLFNVDNTFLKTFRHLFTQPHAVIESYLSGIRKKYMNPVSYFAIGITLSGILFFVLKNVYHVDLTRSSFTNAETPNVDFVFDYQGLLSYLIMPLYALMTWILFLNQKKMNYTEHLVVNAYVTGHMSFVQVLICLPLFGFFNIGYDVFNWVFLLIIVGYQFLVFKKIHKIGFWSTFWRGLAYLVMLVILMLAIGMLIVLITLFTGSMSIEDFAPK